VSKPTLKVVRNEAQASAQIFLYGIVGDYWYSDSPVTARNLQRQLSLLSDVPVIHIHLNGPGGDVHEGLLICNIIKASKKEIHTWNDGICASMMVPILSSVPDGRRHAAKASLTMIHSASTYAWGNAQDMRDTADMLDKHDDVLADIIADALGVTLEDLKTKYFDGNDHWLTAKDAAAEGLFIIEDYEIAEIPENASEQPLDKIAAFYQNSNSNSKPTQINNETMFGSTKKFTALTAMAKLAVTDITPEMVKAANDEIVADKIDGVTLVLDSELEAVSDKADKVDALEAAAKVTAQTIADLQKKVKDLGAAPAEEPEKPVTEVTDSTGKKPEVVTNAFETSFDREMAKLKGK
jgi:ATP-dependent Clp protease protease subunit